MHPGACTPRGWCRSDELQAYEPGADDKSVTCPVGPRLELFLSCVLTQKFPGTASVFPGNYGGVLPGSFVSLLLTKYMH